MLLIKALETLVSISLCINHTEFDSKERVLIDKKMYINTILFNLWDSRRE
jgi:hypothetical protein